jgi:hydrogenase maturation protein HypF
MRYNAPGGIFVADASISRKRLTVTGQVQGVGFRPFAYRLALALGLTGWVRNDPHGAVLEVQGPPPRLAEFARRLRAEAPPLASIETCRDEPACAVAAEKAFDIQASEGGELADAQITVDVSVCGDCLREMRDPLDRRFGYPFINCTQCGPRYSIVRGVPYDRPLTTMADFDMCPDCAREYADPASRRFHAQPIACPRCGPAVWLADSAGRRIASESPIRESARLLRDGKILAVKGLGGFQLACRADCQEAVKRLRLRKRRDAKPFALMAADIAQVGDLCDVSDAARRLLRGPARPIVLMPTRRDGAGLAAGKAAICLAVAEGLSTIGVMLPYTPLHALIFQELAAIGRAEEETPGSLWPPLLVMTSGNFSDEPLEKDNDSAVARLGAIADAMLLHNRRIERRVDDSVVQIHADGSPAVVRRARSFAPRPLRLADIIGDHPPILAVGAELKNAVCLLAGGRALLSEHIGDLKDGRAYRHFMDTIHHLENLFEVQPLVFAADMHPQYLSTQYALRRSRGQIADRPGGRLVRVQHHHAHLASLLAEHGRGGPVIGLIADGVGYGEDGASWGCEVLHGGLAECRRLGHLRYLPLPGGDAAARETLRPAVAAVSGAMGSSADQALRSCRQDVPAEKIEAVLGLLHAGARCPPSSGLGRWFDVAAWLCGVADENRFEAEAAMKLESIADPRVRDACAFSIEAEEPFLIDWRPMAEGMVADILSGAGAAYVAAKFHNTIARFLLAAAMRARELTGTATVGLSGGCFANRRLASRLAETLAEEGFEVLRHAEVPCNDGGIALGQAVAAAASR